MGLQVTAGARRPFTPAQVIVAQTRPSVRGHATPQSAKHGLCRRAPSPRLLHSTMLTTRKPPTRVSDKDPMLGSHWLHRNQPGLPLPSSPPCKFSLPCTRQRQRSRDRHKEPEQVLPTSPTARQTQRSPLNRNMRPAPDWEQLLVHGTH